MSRFARLVISACSLRISLVFTRPYLSPHCALVGLGRPFIVKETSWAFFLLLPSCCLKRNLGGERGEGGQHRILFRGDFSTYLLIPFSVFLAFGTFLHSEGIFSGILFIQEVKREGHSFFVAIARRGTSPALLSVLVFKIVLASGCVFFSSFPGFFVFGVVTAGLDNGLLPFYHFGFCSRRSRLGGLGRCKGLLFWDTFFWFL
jgi:hypothetical protein